MLAVNLIQHHRTGLIISVHVLESQLNYQLENKHRRADNKIGLVLKWSHV